MHKVCSSRTSRWLTSGRSVDSSLVLQLVDAQVAFVPDIQVAHSCEECGLNVVSGINHLVPQYMAA